MSDMTWEEFVKAVVAPARRGPVTQVLSRADLVREVQAYAVAHYNDGGWDVVVECWSDEDIADAIGRARTLKGALRKLAGVVSVYADREADARNSAF